MVLSKIQTGVKAEACSVCSTAKCASVSNCNRALTFSQAKWVFFWHTLHRPLLTVTFARPLFLKSNGGDEPSTAWCAYRNDLIRLLTWGDTGSCDAGSRCRWGPVSKAPCKRHVLPLLHSDGWQKVASAIPFLKSVDGVLHEACWTGQRLPFACMLSLNLPIRKSCLTSVLVWPLSLHFTSLTGVRVRA